MAIFETGVGGELDSTNVLKHLDGLGDTMLCSKPNIREYRPRSSSNHRFPLGKDEQMSEVIELLTWYKENIEKSGKAPRSSQVKKRAVSPSQVRRSSRLKKPRRS